MNPESVIESANRESNQRPRGNRAGPNIGSAAGGRKRCSACGVEKTVSDFYRHPQMGDGYLSKCKECTKADVKSNWETNQAVLRQTYMLRRRLKRQANTAVGNALRDGRLIRPAPCHYCGIVTRLEAHHWDYYRPLDVTWLCDRCHQIADRARKDAELKVGLRQPESESKVG